MGFAGVEVGFVVTSAHFLFGGGAAFRCWFANPDFTVTSTDLWEVTVVSFLTGCTIATTLLGALVGRTFGLARFAFTGIATVFGCKGLSLLVCPTVVFACSRLALLFGAVDFTSRAGASVAAIAFVKGLVVGVGVSVNFTGFGNTLGLRARDLTILTDARVALVFVGKDLATLVASTQVVTGCSLAYST